MDGKAAFGRLFAASRTLRSVAVVQRAIRWAGGRRVAGCLEVCSWLLAAGHRLRATAAGRRCLRGLLRGSDTAAARLLLRAVDQPGIAPQVDPC